MTALRSPAPRRILAVVLPELLVELSLQRLHRAPAEGMPVQTHQRRPDLSNGTQLNVAPLNRTQLNVAALNRTQLNRTQLNRTQSCVTPFNSVAARSLPRFLRQAVPRAVILTDTVNPTWEGKTQLDAVNAVARQLGVSPRQTVAQATAILENLALHALPLTIVSATLKQVAEVALGFGSPVSFRSPDTVWVDVSGSNHLFGSERELALALVAQISALGYAARVAVAAGPWLAQSFARHADFDETGIFLVDAADTRREAGALPIRALPIGDEAVTWFSRLGLLSLDHLRELPQSALAARLGQALETRALETRAAEILDLIQGQDDSVLIAHHPEEMPWEELTWDEPLDNVEPLLFVLKGLSGRLGARLEGRGQAAQEVLLTIQYDRATAALRSNERDRVQLCREVPFKFASPLDHADDLERVVRSRLQRELLDCPATGLRLQVTSITEARRWQIGLPTDAGLNSGLSTDPRSVAVLVAELSADIGGDAVGLLEATDSHLMEKSSGFVPIQSPKTAARPLQGSRRSSEKKMTSGVRSDAVVGGAVVSNAGFSGAMAAVRLPTRLVPPIELKVPLEKNELWVLGQRAFVIESIEFDQRLEAVEWWAHAPVDRDYFRVWLAAVAGRSMSRDATRDGLEVLVYVDRRNGKRYMQALYD